MNADTDIEAEAQNWRWLRPEVQAYARQMEQQLRAHDADRGRTGWKRDNARDLFRHLKMEVKELEQALIRWEELDPEHPDMAHAVRVVSSEAADIGNMAMMVSDVICAWGEEE